MKEVRRHGSGPSRLAAGFEQCREALVDFQVLPHVVDAQGFARLFKVVKLWELTVAENLILAQESSTGASLATPLSQGGGGAFDEDCAEDELNTSTGGLSVHSEPSSKRAAQQALSPGAAGAAETPGSGGSSDPLDFKGCVGNLCLSLR